MEFAAKREDEFGSEGGLGGLFDGGGGGPFRVLADCFSELMAGDAEEGGDESLLGELFDPVGEGAAGPEEGFQAGQKVFGEFAFKFWGARVDSFGDINGKEPRQSVSAFRQYYRHLPAPVLLGGSSWRRERSRTLVERC